MFQLFVLLQNYPKLSQTYYVLLECLAQDHMNFLASLEPNVFLYILSSISEGLNALDTMVCTGCCATLDHIVTYLFKWLSKTNKKSVPTSGSETCLKVLEIQPEILQQMLSTILNIIMFEDCRNQWSMSRPLLGLILLNEEYFNQLRQSIVSQQPSDKQSAMAQWFDNLMEGIERNLLTKNRDRFVISVFLSLPLSLSIYSLRFTQNLSVFRRDINDSLKGPALANASNAMTGGDNTMMS